MIYFASDHAGYALKQELMAFLKSNGFDTHDAGTYNSTDSCNYAEYGKSAAQMVAGNTDSLGVLICGTGAGISMAAGKVTGIRCACVSEPVTARLMREHNNANMISLGARIVGFELAKEIVTAFITTPFSQDQRHKARIATIEPTLS